MDIKERLEKLKSFYRKSNRLPSYAEMLKLFRLSSKNAVSKIVDKFIGEGFLRKENRKLAPSSLFFSIPLLGNIKAGFPIIAEEDKQYLSLDEYLIADPRSSFLLKVSGDSLTGIGIFDGDLVVIERKNQAYTGDIVLAQIDCEWTLKILKRDRVKRISYLLAANPKYPPFYPAQELQIFGIVRAVVRKIH